MWKCPVCDQENNTPFCPRCGFDHSRDWGAFPTLGALSGTSAAASRLRLERMNYRICPECGAAAFSIRMDTGLPRCEVCGLVQNIEIVQPRKNIRAIAAGNAHTVVLYEDGTVRAVGKNNCGQCNTESWSDIISISAGFEATVGLKKDGSAVAVGNNYAGKASVHKLKDLLAVQTSDGGHTVFLHSDHTVTAIGRAEYGECGVDGWTDIMDIAVGNAHTIGLRSDGTVAATVCELDNRCQTAQWSDIVEIAAGGWHTLGRKRDGTVAALGTGSQCDVQSWRDITRITGGGYYSAGLKRDGTVVIAGSEGSVRNAEGWNNVIAIAGGGKHIVGLRSDGVLLAAGDNTDGQCDVYGLSR